MAVNRAELVDRNFRDLIASLTPSPRRDDLGSPVREGSGLSARLALELYESMLASRQLDFVAREMRARNEGFYTIGSTGHEGNAAVAAALRPTDMAFLHYRSGAFFVQRGRQVPGSTPIMDVLLGLASSSDEPIAGGRHKVFGSKALWIPPQTSTIASHLPKAVGTAFALGRATRLRLPVPIPADSVIVASFGDASSNHATACTALNAAALAAFQNLPCPVLFVCEDNGIGISVRTPDDWIQRRFSRMEGIRYFYGDGLDLPHAYDGARAAVDFVRLHRRPAFLHLRTVRLLGHAGSDVELTYRSPEELSAIEAMDPILSATRLLVGEGWLTPDQALALYEDTAERVRALGAEAGKRPRLQTAAQVLAPLGPLHPEALAAEVARPVEESARRAFHGRLPEQDGPRHLAVNINRALGDILLKYPETFLFGEDVARKGGVYNVTQGLQGKAGLARVFNTELDETSILGLGMGFGHLGLIGLPEIQYLAYVHNAIDQIRGEACSLQYFSQDQFRNPMVVRIASLAYQKGFGGHFHNDNAVSALREIPGLLMAAPSNGLDAVGILRTLVAAARVDGRVSTFHRADRPVHDARSARGQRRRLDLPLPRPGLPRPGRIGQDLRRARRGRPDHRQLRQRAVDVAARGPQAGRAWDPGQGRRSSLAQAPAPGRRRGRGPAQRPPVDGGRVPRARRAGRRADRAPGGARPRAQGQGADGHRLLHPARRRGQPRAGPGAGDRGRRAGAGGGSMSPRRALIVLPGRGSYGRDSLGSLAGLDSRALDTLDALRAALGRPTVRALDGAGSYASALHVAGENASILTAGVSLADLEALDPALVRPVAVVGNSMGWYTALGYAGALPLEDAGRLIETMGAYQASNVIGGQLLYPLVGEDWRADEARIAAVQAALDTIPDLYWSIRLGGQAVLGGTEAALAAASATLPKAQLGTTIFPMRLPLHSAFHTPLMAATSARAQGELADLGWRAPTLPLVDGAGRIWRPVHADPAGLRDYTLGAQVVEPFDLALALRVALREYAPELIVLPGPGSNLGGAIAQTLIAEGWAGLRDREQFISRQSNAPVLIALRRPEQRPLAAR